VDTDKAHRRNEGGLRHLQHDGWGLFFSKWNLIFQVGASDRESEAENACFLAKSFD